MSPVRWVRRGATLLLAGALAAGCAPEADDEQVELAVEAGDAADRSPEAMAEIAARIYADPDHAEDIVREAGLTPEGFEARVREITNDPEDSEAYASAFAEAMGDGAAVPPVP